MDIIDRKDGSSRLRRTRWLELATKGRRRKGKEGKKEVTLGGRQDKDKGKTFVCYGVSAPFAQGRKRMNRRERKAESRE